MPGFRLNSSAELDDKYFCRLCKFVLREPIQTSCGHLYCQSCCFRSTTEMHCVVDGTVIREDESFPDKCIKKEILRQRVGCTHQDKGCTWRGMICHLEVILLYIIVPLWPKSKTLCISCWTDDCKSEDIFLKWDFGRLCKKSNIT